MRAALGYLVFTSWKNRVLTRLRRLKQPKYLIGFLVGGFYFLAIFMQRLVLPGHASRAQTGAMPASAVSPQLIENIGAGVMCVIVLLAWVIPHERAALTFSEAEIAFLFPAPVNRRTLIHFKLLKSQIGILYTSLIFTFISFFISVVSRHSLNINAAWIRALSWWSIFSTVNLHFLASSFARTMLLDHGISNRARRFVVLGLVLAAVMIVVIWMARTIPGFDIHAITRLDDLTDYAKQALNSGPLPYLLYAFRLVVRPYLSQNGMEFIRAMGPALLILLVHYWWVVRSNVAFEEASVEASQKMAERIATIRANRGHYAVKPKKKKRPPFRLRPTGTPAVGLLWKNLIGAGQAFTFRFWFFCIWLTLIAVVFSSLHANTSNFAGFVAMMSLLLLGMSYFFGPQLVRQDFRQDLAMADVLKTYPVAGWQIAFGELLAPAVILTAAQWLLIMLAAGLTANLGTGVPLEIRLAAASGLAIIAPALNVLILIIPNAAVLMFPGWFQTGKDTPQGIEVMGQRLIFAFGQMLVLFVTLIPGALAFGIAYFVAQMFLGTYLAVPIASTALALVLAAEAGFGLWGLGRLFERFDLTAQ